jgi:hypothetical protein
LLASQLAIGQAVPTEITNSDVISMTKAGIGEQTIIIAIQRGPVKFDKSPQSLIALKGAGVSDQVLNAILASVNSKSQISPEVQSAAVQALFQKALNARGPHEKLMAILSTRWKGTVIQSLQGGTNSFDRETVTVFPDKVYSSLRAATGQVSKQVITPEFNYRSSGTMTVAIPAADLETMRVQFSFDPINIAQHVEEYTVTSPEENQLGNITPDRIQISRNGKNIIWKVDPQTGRLLSTHLVTASSDVMNDYSDWRLIDGVYIPFKRHMSEPGHTNDFTITEYEINPIVDSTLFQRPIQTPSQGLTLKVLQSQSVPYIQESGGGISANCNIVGTANTSAYANTLGNSTFGNATTNSNQHMSCNSYDTTIRWPHVLNVMFAEASDGNSYMFACDRAWRWSKCVPLRVGQVFNARFTDKGLEVEAFNTKGKEENPTYHVLQSKSSRQN